MVVMSDTRNKFSLVECMQEAPNSRTMYNQKHKFIDVIMIAVTVIPCGMDTWNEIGLGTFQKRMAGKLPLSLSSCVWMKRQMGSKQSQNFWILCT